NACAANVRSIVTCGTPCQTFQPRKRPPPLIILSAVTVWHLAGCGNHAASATSRATENQRQSILLATRRYSVLAFGPPLQQFGAFIGDGKAETGTTQDVKLIIFNGLQREYGWQNRMSFQQQGCGRGAKFGRIRASNFQRCGLRHESCEPIVNLQP